MQPDKMLPGMTFVEQRLMARTPLVLFLMGAVILARIVYYTGYLPDFGGDGVSDFNLFYVIAKAIGGGELPQTYHLESLMDLMQKYGGFHEPIPWAYPPPFNLVLAPLGLMPLAMAYTLFVGGSFVAWVMLLKRQAGSLMILPIIITFPGVFVALSSGQNGFFTALLLGLAATWMLERQGKAGIPLGIMVIKPHLAISLGIAALFKKRWQAIVIAAFVALLLCGLATASFGVDIWQSYRNAVKESVTFLDQGLFPTVRMVTVYAAMRSLSIGSQAAFIAQVISALMIIAAIVHVSLRKDARAAFALALVTAPLISPYAYDYDTPISTVGFALIIGRFISASTVAERVSVYILGIVATGSGIFSHFPRLFVNLFALTAEKTPLSFAGFFYIALVVILYRVILRMPQEPEV